MSGPYLEALPPELRRKWAAARVWAAHQMPYLANALLSLEPVVVPDTDDTGGGAALRRFPADVGWHIHLSLAEVDRHAVPEIGFWILHQLTHLLRQHAERFPETGDPAEQRMWNFAADAEFDDDLRAGDVTLPAEAATPGRLGLPRNQLAERYWAMLRESTEPVDAIFSDGDCGNACDVSSSEISPRINCRIRAQSQSDALAAKATLPDGRRRRRGRQVLVQRVHRAEGAGRDNPRLARGT